MSGAVVSVSMVVIRDSLVIAEGNDEMNKAQTIGMDDVSQYMIELVHQYAQYYTNEQASVTQLFQVHSYQHKREKSPTLNRCYRQCINVS